MGAAQKAEIAEFPEKVRYKPETAEALLALYKREQALQDGPAWLKDLRNGAMTALEQNGLPTPRLERWKFTNMIPAVRELTGAWSEADIICEGEDNLVGTLVDKIANSQEWLKKIISGKQAELYRYGDMMLWDVADMFMRDGIVIDVPDNHICEKPVTLRFTGHDGGFTVPRIIVRLGKGSSLTLIEEHSGQGAYWNNAAAQIEVGANARLRHYRIQENSDQAVYTQSTALDIARDGIYEGFTLCNGAALSRNQMHVSMSGENAECNIYGLNTLGGGQHGDTTIEIEHKVPHCNSFQFIRSVLDGQARGVFQGKVHVHEGADQTDGTQMSNALILSEGAEMDTKPELEIYADDVQCAHGATTGKLEDEPLFYMRTRGMDEETARRLLIEAFVGEIVEKLADESVRETVSAKVQAWLG